MRFSGFPVFLIPGDTAGAEPTKPPRSELAQSN
jgi:hypothetical protein